MLSHPSVLLDLPKELPSRVVVHDKDERIFALEGPVQLGVKRVTDVSHDIPFIENQLLFLVF